MPKSEGSRTILTTGVSRGIGRALVERFAEGGHTILGCARSRPLISEIRDRHGPPHDFLPVDVADDDRVRAWAERAVARGQVPDLIINNAAVITSPARLWEVRATELSDLIDINVKGVVAVIRHFLPPMLERGSGVIVNVSSGWGRSTSPLVAPYCASKWAIEGLTRALAQELPEGFAAVTFSPGMVHTDMLAVAFGKEQASAAIDPDAWSRLAAPMILAIGPAQNGEALSF